MNNRLKVLRAEQDWSQQHLADLLDVSRQTILTARFQIRCTIQLSDRRNLPAMKQESQLNMNWLSTL